MKTSLVAGSEPVKEFKPFEITFKPETIEEARLLFHLCNHASIGDKIGKTGYSIYGYKTISSQLNSTGYREIRAEIEGQGFSI